MNKTQQFIEKARRIHGDKYDYSVSEYKGYQAKIDIRCPDHGIFKQRPSGHTQGCGCPKCGNILRSKSNTCTTDKFIEKAIRVHGDRYDYSRVIYSDNETKVLIGCPKHGYFLQTPHGHLKGRICKKCAMEDLRESTKVTLLDFVDKARNTHGDTYDYSYAEYKDAHTKTEIVCKKHGSFYQTPNDHLSGYGCPSCGYEIVSEKRTLSQEEFIKRVKEIYKDEDYNYEKTTYVNALTDVIVTCPKHGDFKQNAHNFLQGHGCQICTSSVGEKRIKSWLESNNVKFLRQHKFKGLRNKRNLRFDFYLPERNTLIEYDGKQHFEPVRFNGISIDKAVEAHNKVKYLDTLKNRYCQENNIKLIRIDYKCLEDISSVLSSKLLIPSV